MNSTVKLAVAALAMSTLIATMVAVLSFSDAWAANDSIVGRADAAAPAAPVAFSDVWIEGPPVGWRLIEGVITIDCPNHEGLCTITTTGGSVHRAAASRIIAGPLGSGRQLLQRIQKPPTPPVVAEAPVP